jgi:hypothetical protein
MSLHQTCAALMVAMIASTGCTSQNREPIPITHAAEGKVVHKNDAPYTKGGAIEFVHSTKPGVRAVSHVNERGEFELHTITAQQKLKGAEEGTYKVQIFPKSEDQNVTPIMLSKTFVIAAGVNKLTVNVDD